MTLRMTDSEKKSDTENPYPAEKARQGEIILRTRIRRIIFIAGLAAVVILVLVLRFIS